MTPGVVADGQVGEPVGRSDATIKGAGALGGLGGVLGHVARDLGVGHVAAGGHRPYIELASQLKVRAGSPGAVGVVTLTLGWPGRWRR